jgi:hypothetical protein
MGKRNLNMNGTHLAITGYKYGEKEVMVLRNAKFNVQFLPPIYLFFKK